MVDVVFLTLRKAVILRETYVVYQEKYWICESLDERKHSFFGRMEKNKRF